MTTIGIGPNIAADQMQMAQDRLTDQKIKVQENQGTKESIAKLSEEFEAIFMQIVLKSMRQSIQKSDLIDGGNGEEIFRSMLDQEYAKSFSQQRTSGLADSIQNHLLRISGKAVASPQVIPAQSVIDRYQKAVDSR